MIKDSKLVITRYTRKITLPNLKEERYSKTFIHIGPLSKKQLSLFYNTRIVLDHNCITCP